MKTVLAVLVVLIPCGYGQTSNPPAPLIEVAVIKPTNWQSSTLFERMRTASNGCPRMIPVINGNRLALKNAPICSLVRIAFDIEPYQILSAPKWFRASEDPTIYYDMQVQAEGAEITSEQATLMLQELLSDRFRLAFHWESRELPVYEMTVAQSGSKLSTEDLDCGSKLRGVVTGNCRMTVTTAWLASMLSGLSTEFDRPVIDKTGLPGKYPFRLVYSPANTAYRPADTGLTADLAPDIFTAVREQLGLSLVPGEGQVRVLVIDSVERPTEN